MKKISLSFVLLVYVSAMLFCQIDTKKTIFYHNTLISEKEGIKLMAKNPISKFNYSKFELIIENNSDFFVLFSKPEKCIFKFGSEKKSPSPKRIRKIIRPERKISPTLKVTGGSNFLIEKYEFIPGGIFKFSQEGEITEAPDFHLPANKNEFSFGDFKVRMLKIKKETKETVVQFKCTYNGDKIALISPSKTVIKTKDGKEWANQRAKDKTKVLMKNEDVKIKLVFKIPGKIVDMQFAEMDILWKNTFSETELIQVDFDSNFIKIDPVKTAEKNK